MTATMTSFGRVGGNAPDMDEGTYPVTITRCEGPIKSNYPNEQTGEYPMQVKIFMSIDDGTPGELTDFANLPSDGRALGKKSKLYGICVAFLGREPEEGEELGPGTIIGMSAQAVVLKKDNGWPKVTQYLKSRRTPQATPTVATDGFVAGPARPATPVAPTRPTAPARPVAAVRSEERAIDLMNAAVQAEYDEATLTGWIASNYPGKTLETISPAECDALIAALGSVPF